MGLAWRAAVPEHVWLREEVWAAVESPPRVPSSRTPLIYRRTRSCKDHTSDRADECGVGYVVVCYAHPRVGAVCVERPGMVRCDAGRAWVGWAGWSWPGLVGLG